MKRRMKINYILTLILVFCIGASIPVLTGSSQVTEQHSAKSEVPYCVTSPTVPAQVTFDGETIDLRRYDRRERMDREMMAFTYMHSTTMLLIKRANRYFPIIEPILKANGIPDDFKYLMVIESNLNNIARDYGLHQISIEEGGKEPSPAHLKDLIDVCQAENVGVIFVQPEFDKRNAETIAQQTGTKVVPINPLSYDWEEEMLNVAKALAPQAATK